jgi:hypothetical protein
MVTPLIITKSEETPLVVLNNEEAVYFFEGVSIPENPEKFYNQIINWLDEFKKTVDKQMLVIFKIKYYNSAS